MTPALYKRDSIRIFYIPLYPKVGGGIASLYASLLLPSKGVAVHIFEANDRVGGRVWTYRFSDDKEQFFEAGTMRIPKSPIHRPVLDIIFNRVYLNDGRRDDGSKFSLSDFDSLTAHRLGFDLPHPYTNITAIGLLEPIIQTFVKALQNDFTIGYHRIMKHDDLSFRMYLRSAAQWPPEVIDFYSLGFTEVIGRNMDFSTREWFTIKDGMDRLPNAMARITGPQNITLNARVRGFAELPSGGITINFDSSAATNPMDIVFDSVILALPLQQSVACLLTGRDGRPLEAALRAVYFKPLFKLGLPFKTRFWEARSSSVVWGTIHHGPLGRLPFQWDGHSGARVLLTYPWMTDANTWLPLDFAKLLHKEINVHNEFIEGKAICGSSNWSRGDAMFLPGQHTAYARVLATHERGVYFAGEHLSCHHAWIVGAIDSALNTSVVVIHSKRRFNQ
ncbi:FAD/NAD(P)-binding domain-containing protein [Pleurotus eryngii]|uniref:FAD/NAD(P)-binding domain-containing protein n=1 Tax=Pleurotus eryngii TaxID=5323 RepID=A0A9P6D6R1_PLEER|nr:FAD/NAD(P)-binding domain-containing protein [Pleurotus eryngii]